MCDLIYCINLPLYLFDFIIHYFCIVPENVMTMTGTVEEGDEEDDFFGESFQMETQVS